MGHPAPGMTLDRIDGAKGYSPENCRWASMEEQNENVSRNVFVSFNGEEKIIKHWAKDFDLDPRRVSERLRRGWSIEKTLMTPTPKSYEEARLEYCAYAKSLWAERGIQYARNSKRKRRGLPPLISPFAPSNSQGRTRATPKVKAQVIWYWQKGMTMRQIAGLTKVSKSNAAYIVRAFKIAELAKNSALPDTSREP
jgi:hypothetical protein